ncbi:hypothetical protein NCCP2716_13770 [Sporosarcina sp. NCCP-2716]|uniref:hypothetical protein n=1 Tax=Sporosarcina sp. NCCP-2716 TaxID=2943679 RepID=UPI00203D71E2|nr:hypothetical protein [Sporosarcina sp. NCCP-2716]GKV68879.1 hypothetical protein NCCP2716_13770 [Sporosarcina sp. NCCP-2716]
MEKMKEFAGMAAVTVLFSLFTWALISSYLEEYPLLSYESATVMSVEKTGEKGLFTPPSYYVRVTLPNGKEAPYMNRISKKQVSELKPGDPVKGYSSGPSDFSTIRDIIIDSVFYLIGICVLGFLALCCLIATFLSIPGLERMEQTSGRKRTLKKKRKMGREQRKVRKVQSGWGIAGIFVFVFLAITSRFLVNLSRKLLPFGKTETEALIYDTYSHVTYRKHEDSAYEFTVAFQDSAGQTVKAVKNVTRHTYQQYGLGDKLPISYRDANPYDIFVRGTTVQDLLQATITAEFFLYAALLAVSAFVGWAFFDSRQKRK